MSTGCIPQQLEFQRLGPEAGGGLVRWGDPDLGWQSGVAGRGGAATGHPATVCPCFRDQRNPELIEHSVEELVRRPRGPSPARPPAAACGSYGHQALRQTALLRLQVRVESGERRSDPTELASFAKLYKTPYAFLLDAD
jgi:hypothetical protein